MRLGIMSDIHANLHALRAVLGAMRRAGVDTVVCAGDVVGYGPHPNECVEIVASLGAKCVAGNHDLMAIGRLPIEGVSRLATESLHWTCEELNEAAVGYLRALPARLALAELVVAHGALDDARTYVVAETQASGELAQLAREDAAASLLVLGHSHERWVYVEDGKTLAIPRDGRMSLASERRHLLNPGSVGQSRQWEWQPRARFMLLDLELRRLDCQVIEYDVASCRDALRTRGLPEYSLHVFPGRLGRAVSRLRQELSV